MAFFGYVSHLILVHGTSCIMERLEFDSCSFYISLFLFTNLFFFSLDLSLLSTIWKAGPGRGLLLIQWPLSCLSARVSTRDPTVHQSYIIPLDPYPKRIRLKKDVVKGKRGGRAKREGDAMGEMGESNAHEMFFGRVHDGETNFDVLGGGGTDRVSPKVPCPDDAAWGNLFLRRLSAHAAWDGGKESG